MGRMKNTDAASIVKLKIEKMGLTIEELARQKVEAMQGNYLRMQDSAAYRLQAANERSKVHSFKDVIFRLKERARNPVANPSRMDPLNSYNLEAVQKELEEAQERSKEFEQTANQYQQDAERYNREVVGFDERLMKLNREGLLREAEEITPDGPA